MDLIARKKLNLEVLKRHDADICDILDQSAHAVVYKFDTEKTSWVINLFLSSLIYYFLT